MQAGVGTNRYAYANNDPINKFDPNGNFFGALLAQFAISMVMSDGDVLGSAAGTLFGVPGQAMVSLSRGADPGDVLKSALFQVAAAVVMQGLQDAMMSGGKSEAMSDWEGAHAADVRDSVIVNENLDLTVSGNTISGSQSYACNGSASFCGQFVSESMEGLANHKAGQYRLELTMKAVSDPNKADLTITQRNKLISTKRGAKGEYVGARNRETGAYIHRNEINIRRMPLRFNYVVRHEVGHWLGLGHQLGSDSIMSYTYGGNNFSAVDLERLINAY